jgi:hypothetical protein
MCPKRAIMSSFVAFYATTTTVKDSAGEVRGGGLSVTSGDIERLAQCDHHQLDFTDSRVYGFSASHAPIRGHVRNARADAFELEMSCV